MKQSPAHICDQRIVFIEVGIAYVRTKDFVFMMTWPLIKHTGRRERNFSLTNNWFRAMVTQTADLDSGRRGNLESVIEKRYGTVEVSLEERKKRGGVRGTSSGVRRRRQRRPVSDGTPWGWGCLWIRGRRSPCLARHTGDRTGHRLLSGRRFSLRPGSVLLTPNNTTPGDSLM
jgi:hypothetical protein